MSGKILVAYASKTCATERHAGAIAGALKGAGRDVDIIDLREIRKANLESYGAVIIGSGVRFGRWYGHVRRLLKRKELAGMDMALFVSCGMLADNPTKEDDAVKKYIDKVAEKYGVKTISRRGFGGFMPGGKDFKSGKAGVSRPVDTAASEGWGRELAELL